MERQDVVTLIKQCIVEHKHGTIDLSQWRTCWANLDEVGVRTIDCILHSYQQHYIDTTEMCSQLSSMLEKYFNLTLKIVTSKHIREPKETVNEESIVISFKKHKTHHIIPST